MHTVKLGSSSLRVSPICLGSMTWGFQNNQDDANIQIDYALANGVNFIDTAEMYAIPPTKDTFGKTETIIGHWLAANPKKRKDIILASKIAGPGISYIRDGVNISGKTVIEAVNDSLTRLQTDYIDLYQIHWPNRNSPHFAKHWPNDLNFTTVDKTEQIEGMLDILRGLETCIKAGKIRFCGLSDESPWGINQYLRLSEQHNLPRMVSIQNEFSLLHHKDWPYLIENCVHEDIAYLPWSPLATGLLTGKYAKGAMPEGSRLNFIQRQGQFRNTKQTHLAVDAFVALAKKHHISPVQLALGWCKQVDGVTSTIIGATKLEQLKENIAAFSTNLSDDILFDLRKTIKSYPSPY